MSLIKIEDLFHFEKGVLQSSKCIEGEYDFITASSEWKTNNEYTHNCEALVFAAAASGSLGRTHYVNGKFISSDLCFIITPKDPINYPIDLKFYHIIFNELKNDIVKNTKAGTSKEAIGMKSFGNYCLPYFEINQQIEIKQQFEKMLSINKGIDEELSHQLSLIKQLRQAFLREAMQGCFEFKQQTLQDGEIETGAQLLEKIKAEKAQLIKEKKLKKEKELPSISEDEIPFEIPEHWVWCRGNDLANYIDPQPSHRTPPISKDGIPYVAMSDIKKDGTIDFNSARKVSLNILDEHQKRYQLEDGDFIFGKIGTIGKPVLLPQPFEYTLSANVILIQPNRKIILDDFLYYFLGSPVAEKNLIDKKTNGY